MAMILASQSPRRRELLGQMGFSFTVRPAKGEELPHPELTPAQLVEELARQKALEVSAEAEADDVVVAADTVVAIDGKVLGKPHDKVHAAQMLSALSGREHTVYTGVAVKRGETLLVEGIRGDYFNVVGLPICRLGRMLAQVGEDALAQCAQKCAEKER